MGGNQQGSENVSPRRKSPDDRGSADDGDPLAGTRYRTLGPLGSGGMGHAVEAEDLQEGSLVVVKLLRRELQHRHDLIDRMRLELDALSTLHHPNVVGVKGSGATPEGRPFIVMERLYGRTFHDELEQRGRPLAPREAIEYVTQALAGLGAAHERGVVHRDIKLENLFVCHAVKGRRVVKVLDFGIAKVLSTAPADGPSPLATPTQFGVLMGTPRFMSPEQASGRAVDARTDLYAMGLVLYILLAGRGPFDDKKGTEALMEAHRSETPDPPSRYSPWSLPQELDRAVLSALEKDPARRFSGAAEFASTLRAIAGRIEALPGAEGVFRANDKCDKYPIVRLIGLGGTGEVYEARHPAMELRIALKCLQFRHMQDTDLRKRMMMEAALLVELRHPNLVAVHDAGITDAGVAWMTMEYLEGSLLRARMRPGRGVSLAKVLEWTRQIALGVAAAHEVRVVHRDLKPENVFLTDDDRIKVLDFGTAKFFGYGMRTTGRYSIGTPAYMAPEQIEGGVVDVRADIYALGVIFYEMIAGSHPFAEGGPVEDVPWTEIALRHLHATPQPLHELSPACPPPVWAAVKRAMSKAREERQSSVLQFYDELAAAATGDKPSARPQGGWVDRTEASPVPRGVRTSPSGSWGRLARALGTPEDAAGHASADDDAAHRRPAVQGPAQGGDTEHLPVPLPIDRSGPTRLAPARLAVDSALTPAAVVGGSKPVHLRRGVTAMGVGVGAIAWLGFVLLHRSASTAPTTVAVAPAADSVASAAASAVPLALAPPETQASPERVGGAQETELAPDAEAAAVASAPVASARPAALPRAGAKPVVAGGAHLSRDVSSVPAGLVVPDFVDAPPKPAHAQPATDRKGRP